jgi:hypothetical protein
MTRGVLLIVLLAAVGCSWAKKPYADDPLVQGKRAVVGNPVQCAPVEDWDRPAPPPPPPNGK